MRNATTLAAALVLGGALLAGGPGAGPVGAQEPPESLTLEEAVRRALERSPQMAQVRQQVTNAEEGKRVAWASFLPTVSSSYSGSVRSSQRFDPTTDRVVSGTSSDSYSAGLSARYTLFSGGSRFSDLDAAEADVEAAVASSRDREFQVALQTENLFFGALRQAELLETARSRLEQADTSLAMTRRQAQVGAATSSDTLRARLELVNARQAVLEAETAVENARVSLGRQVGVAGPVIPEAPADLDPKPLALSDEEILQEAVATSPSVVSAEASLGAARAAVSSAKGQWLPSLSLSSGVDWASQTLGFDQPTRSWSVRFSASYPIFNGFQRESSIARARSSADVARLQQEDARLMAREEASAALRNLRTAERAIEIAEEALEVAREDLRVVRERYRVGVARIFDVIVSQVALDQAQTDLVSARYDYVLARAELEAVVGREL